MADYYTKFSVRVPLTPHEVEIAHDFNFLMDEIQKETLSEHSLLGDRPIGMRMSLLDMTPTVKKLLGFLGSDTEYDPLEGVTVHVGNDSLWICAEESGCPEMAASLLQLLAPSSLPLSFEWSNSCSKMRTDGFSGGAVVVDKTKCEWILPGNIAQEKLNEWQQASNRKLSA